MNCDGLLYRALIRVRVRARHVHAANESLRWDLRRWATELSTALRFREEMRYYYPEIWSVDGNAAIQSPHLKFFNE